jgi:UDPglucose 6-dehydrogenase
MRVSVIGAGYVGLITGVCLASRAHDVTVVDLSQPVVDGLNQGRPHIYERQLDGLLRSVLDAGRFRATTDLAKAATESDVIIVAVGTPSVDGAIDLTQVRASSASIGALLARNREHRSVVIKSTVLPGTTDTVVRQTLEASGLRAGEFGLGMNPEFLREGEAIDDFMHPDRIVLGHEDARTLARLEELYASWDCEKLRVNTRTAELIKYANNALLATQISTMNEIANLAGAIGGIDAMEVVEGVQLDGRWSPRIDGRRVSPGVLRYLVPGCGFGGSCFPKDVQALRTQGESLGLPMAVLNAVLTVNETQPEQVLQILSRELGDLRSRSCLVLGLAFKPDTDDVRESASIKIVRSLLAAGAGVAAHDPIAAPNFARALGNDRTRVAFVDDWRAAAARADVIVIATAWAEYEGLADLDLAGKTVFDARRMFEPARLAGARYLSIGRRLAEAAPESVTDAI